jgi:hypothetical protein
MAGAGAGLVLVAILAGYGLSRLFRHPPPPQDEPTEKETGKEKQPGES